MWHGVDSGGREEMMCLRGEEGKWIGEEDKDFYTPECKKFCKKGFEKIRTENKNINNL